MKLLKRLLILTGLVLVGAWWVTASIEDYRGLIFRTKPADDYVPYILYLASAGEEGMLPNSPRRERVFSVAAIVPFYKVAPEIRFSLLDEGIDASRLKATLAQSMATQFALLIAAFVVALAIATRTGAVVAAAATLAASPVYFLSTYIGGVDGIAIAVVAFILHAALRERFWLCALLVVISIGVNEKILIFAFPFFLTYALHRNRSLIPWLAAVVAATTYYILRSQYGTGNPQQLDPGSMLGSALASIAISLSPRGVMLGAIPLVVVCAPMAAALLVGRGQLWNLALAGLGAAVGLFAIALIGNPGNLTLGKIAAYSMPVSMYCLGALLARLERQANPVSEASESPTQG